MTKRERVERVLDEMTRAEMLAVVGVEDDANLTDEDLAEAVVEELDPMETYHP